MERNFGRTEEEGINLGKKLTNAEMKTKRCAREWKNGKKQHISTRQINEDRREKGRDKLKNSLKKKSGNGGKTH